MGTSTLGPVEMRVPRGTTGEPSAQVVAKCHDGLGLGPDPSSAGRWPARENCQLGIESPLVGGPYLAAGDIGGEVRICIQKTGGLQPEQHRHHHQVAGTERTVEPVGIPKATGKLVQPVTDAILDKGAGAARARACRAPRAWRLRARESAAQPLR